ncbi:MAG: DUF2855 family protein [Flavobacteriaceae bacterium]
MKIPKKSQFQVVKSNFTKNNIQEIPEDHLNLSEGEILVQIDLFSFTSNNITYAVSGNIIRYWEFFPALGEQTQEWGVIPVWGFADVVESKTESIPVGDRIFGYFPPATHLKIKADRITEKRFIDGSEHRASLPPTYNLYKRVLSESNYDKNFDRDRALFYPLYITSFCLWDSLKENNWHGAKQIVILSASSKTSIGLAYALHQDDSSPKAVGITSNQNLKAIEKLGFYDSSLTYEQVSNLDNSLPTVVVDMSGNNSVLVNLHQSLKNQMKFTLKVGLTHWKETNPNEGIIRERSKFFFAPSHIEKRIQDWGSSEFDRKTSSFLVAATTQTKKWLNYKELQGLKELKTLYQDVCSGSVPADVGLIVKM